jgi:hypothetical protein
VPEGQEGKFAPDTEGALQSTTEQTTTQRREQEQVNECISDLSIPQLQSFFSEAS